MAAETASETFQTILRYMNVVELARFQLNLRYSTVQVLPGYPVGVKNDFQLNPRYMNVVELSRFPLNLRYMF